MKFKVKSIQAINQESSQQRNLASKNETEVDIPGDHIEFQKQVYQTIQSYIRGQDRQWCSEVLVQVLVHQPSILSNLIDRVFQDSLRSISLRVTKSEMEQEQKDLLMVKAVGNLLESAQDIEINVLGGQVWVLPGVRSFIEQTYKDQIENALIGVFKLLGAVLEQSNASNLKIMLDQTEKPLVLLHNTLIEQLFLQILDEVSELGVKQNFINELQNLSSDFQKTYHRVIIHLQLQLLHSSGAKCESIKLLLEPSQLNSEKGILQACKALLALCQRYSGGDMGLLTNFRTELEDSLTSSIILLSQNQESAKPRVIKLIEIKSRFIDSMLSISRSDSGIIGISTQTIIQTISTACMRSLTDQAARVNVSREIARALFEEPKLDRSLIQSILTFNTDRDRLELEIRLRLVSVIVDGEVSKLQNIRSMLEVVGDHFGNRFCFKFLAIIKEFASFQLAPESATSSSALTLPASLWPLSIASIKQSKLLSANLTEFSQKYASKFHKRKIQTIIPFLGKAVVSFKNKFEFTASGLQAHALLMFNINKTQKKENLAGKLGITREQLEEVLKKLVEIGMLDSGKDTFEVRTDFRPSQESTNASLNLSSITILQMMESKSGFQKAITAPKEQSDKPLLADTTHSEHISIAYNHKEHKHRIQAYIVKTLKKDQSSGIEELHAQIKHKFGMRQNDGGPRDLIIDMKQENIDKNIKELSDRGFLSIDEDLSMYEYLRE